MTNENWLLRSFKDHRHGGLCSGVPYFFYSVAEKNETVPTLFLPQISTDTLMHYITHSHALLSEEVEQGRRFNFAAIKIVGLADT